MKKGRWLLLTSAIVWMAVMLFMPAGAQAQKKLYIGGTQSLTGPFAEDSAAVLAGIEDYAKYVNETKNLAPWRQEKFPADITLEVLWRDDELKPPKALSIYEELKAKGMLVARISGSPIALALKDRLWEEGMGATSMATGPYYLSPPQSCFTYYPIYTDCMGAIADWFKGNWKETRKPKVAYLTADNAMGKSIEIPEMKAYLEYLREESRTCFEKGLSSFEAAKRIDLGPYSKWRAPSRLYLNVERAYREFRHEPEDKPWDSARSFDLIYKIAKARGLALEF